MDKKAGYNDRHSNGSGKSLKYSFNNEATSCGLVSESNVFNEPQSSSSRNCLRVQQMENKKIKETKTFFFHFLCSLLNRIQ